MFLAKRDDVEPLQREKGHDIIRARFAEESVYGTANRVGVSKTTVSRVITAYTNLGHIVVLRRIITGRHYRSIHADYLHPMFQALFTGKRPMFQGDNTPVLMSHYAQTWLYEHYDEVENLTWYLQSSIRAALNVLWCVLPNEV
ncbi:hypothetical protein TNCV_1323311 [Trichonephila clavipes]|nr:hypothetical protein TNCV_1323311 [Trichonephila clavipes]